MGRDQKVKYRYGLIGKDISYSFSERYFNEKFNELNLDNYIYQNFDIKTIKNFTEIIQKTKKLRGLNVTIPYKEVVMDYLDEIDEEAVAIGAVNTIKILKNGKLKGFNTDVYGFEKSIVQQLKEHHKKALILGTGGASKGIIFVLKKMDIEVLSVSRNPIKKDEISYDNITESIINEYTIIVNCSPVGTHPNTEECPNIPYQYITSSHLLYDLIYNPSKTLFLKKGSEKGATICNGSQMLELQAEKAWEIWNS
jgi:shikimate dehydrogenase